MFPTTHDGVIARAGAEELNRDVDMLLQAYRELAMFEGCELITPESQGIWGDTPLHVAAYDNDVAALKALMPFVKNINVLGEWEFTPLHSAILRGSVESAAYLISQGADVHCVNRLEENALEMMGDAPAFHEIKQQYELDKE